MATRALVDDQIDQGARLLAALDEAEIPVAVAYWLLSPEWGQWWLVLGTHLLNDRDSLDLRVQVFEIQDSLGAAEFLVDKLGIVGMNHRWVRALKERLPRGLPKPGYWLGGFWSGDANLSVEDSYVYRFEAQPKIHRYGAAPKRRASRNGSASAQHAKTTSGA